MSEVKVVPHNYKKHISFDNISPSLIDEEIRLLKNNNRFIAYNNKFYHIPPQFNPHYNQFSRDNSIDDSSRDSTRHSSRPQLFVSDLSSKSLQLSDTNKNSNVAFNSSNSFSDFVIKPSVYKTTSGSSRSESPFERQSMASNLSSVRLPPPPEQSILKVLPKSVDELQEIENIDISDLSDEKAKQMGKVTQENTQLNSGSKAGYTQSLFSNLNEIEDRILNRQNKLDHNENGTGRNQKKKSFANMTNEELSALEDSYTALGRSTHATIDQYDFGKQNPVFIDSSKKANSTIKISNTIADSLACVYPSRPSVEYKAISLTVENKQFQDCTNCVHGKLNNKYKDENGSLRVVSCYISGRRFTWSTVDWYIENVARDGDHLVVITCIPDFEEKIDSKVQNEKLQDREKELLNIVNKSSTKRKSGKKKKKDKSLSTGALLEGVYEESKNVCKSLLNYYANRLKDKKVKITIEMVKENSTKIALTQVAALYKPSIHIVATVSANIQIKFRNGNVKLPFFVMKHYTIPVIVVPFEFIQPNLLIEGAPHEKCTVTKDKRMEFLDSVIQKTLKNPFLDNYDDNCSIGSSDEEKSVESVDGYFPVSSEQQSKSNRFEQLGYIFPEATREKLLKTNSVIYDQDGKRITPVTSKNSRRSSRVQFQETGLYKVRSMIDGALTPNELQQSNNTIYLSNTTPVIRKTKSVSAPSFRTKSSQHNHRNSKGSDELVVKHHTNYNGHITSTSSRESSYKEKEGKKNKNSKKKKGGFGSMFRKVFG